jgi:murein DD-endopeptidase MepM/ murein hydrolase activator NlpD
MREAVPERRLQRTSWFVAFVCLGLLAAICVQLMNVHRQLSGARRELAWTQARLAERRDVTRRQRIEIAQLAAGIERAARVTAQARDGAAKLRRLARLEQSGEPETSPIRPISIPDTGAALVSEPTAQALEQLAWLEEQTAATNESVTFLTALVTNGPADGGTPPWEWPVYGAVSSDFGGRWSPWGGGWKFHAGLDLRAAQGTPVSSAGAGTVVFAGRMRGYGNMVVVDHGFELKTVYAHLSRIYVDRGARVEAGEVIAAVGQTGHATGPHLHYEVRVGAAPVDPMCYLDGAGRQARPLALTVGG